MAIALTNALLVDIDPMRVEIGALRIDGTTIAARGLANPQPHDQIIDCQGAVVLPGLVNGHTHLYSALAAGMPAPPRQPTNFHEVLQLIWWRLDQALDAESNEMSATIGALDALRCGTTTLIDHHASPRAIAGSLDAVEQGIANVGLRGILCYETTDRHGKSGRDAGLEENRRYLNKCAAATFSRRGHAASFVGAHASFTLTDESLAALSALAKQFETPLHIHVAEDPCDDELSRANYGKPLFARLESHDLITERNVFAHAIHLPDAAIARVNAAGLRIAHNPRSNMVNAVGYAPIQKLTCPIQLGTDGIGSDLFTEAKVAWLKSCDNHAGIAPQNVLAMLVNSARCASQALGVTLGKLEVGAAADVVITDYIPFTPLTTDNLVGHFLHGMGVQNVRHVIVDGQVALRDRVVQTCDEPAIRAKSQSIAAKLWQRMESIPA